MSQHPSSTVDTTSAVISPSVYDPLRLAQKKFFPDHFGEHRVHDGGECAWIPVEFKGASFHSPVFRISEA